MGTIRQHTVWLAVLAISLSLAGPALAQANADAGGADERQILLLQAKPQAYGVIESLGSHEDARVRLAVLEAVQHAPDAAFEIARNALSDQNPAVRFAALVTIGELEITRLADAAADLLQDENASVRAAAIFALDKCGRDVDLSPLGAMLGSARPGVRANAAMLIGKLGDDRAIPMLREMAALPMPRVSTNERQWVRLQFAEAMIRLNPNDAEVLGTIRAAVYSNLDDLRVLAIQILGEVGDRSVLGGLAHIIEEENPIQMQIAAAQSLTQMGDRRGAETLLTASRYDQRQLNSDLQQYLQELQENSPEAQAIRDILANPQLQGRTAAEVRAQAVIALGWVDSTAAAQRLAQLLSDPSPIVRVAAASSILRATR